MSSALKTTLKNISVVIGIILVGWMMAALVSFAQVWNPPTGSPPTANTPTPLNVSSVNQIKSGGLWLASLGLDGGAVIGTDIDVTGVYKKSGVAGTAATCAAGQTPSGITISGGIITSAGTCTAVGGAAGISGSGTAGNLTKWISSSSIGNYGGASCPAGQVAAGLTASGNVNCVTGYQCTTQSWSQNTAVSVPSQCIGRVCTIAWYNSLPGLYGHAQISQFSNNTIISWTSNDETSTAGIQDASRSVNGDGLFNRILRDGGTSSVVTDDGPQENSPGQWNVRNFGGNALTVTICG